MKMQVNRAFKPLLDDKHRINIVYGGAGSGKSKFVADREILKHVKRSGHKHLIVRKTNRTHRDSTFDELRKTIYGLGLFDKFKVNMSDLRLTYKPHNSEFVFLGLDDSEKLKSVSGITDVWVEEATEISESDFDQIDLRVRGFSDIHKQITLTFNPVSALHWIKKRFFDKTDVDAVILKTTFKDNAFLDKKYIERLKNLAESDPVKYAIYALGDWGVLGSLVYTNYVVEEFDKDLFNSYYNGLDWGYNDPAAGVKMAFKDDEIYILDEFYVTGLDNVELMNRAETIWSKELFIIADNSEPKSIKEWKKAGWWNLKPARKGKDSVKHGIGWVRSHKMHIHPDCQNFINEIQGYSYREDREKNILEQPVDFKNHLMDCMRYGFEPLMAERQWTFA